MLSELNLRFRCNCVFERTAENRASRLAEERGCVLSCKQAQQADIDVFFNTNSVERIEMYVDLSSGEAVDKIVMTILPRLRYDPAKSCYKPKVNKPKIRAKCRRV